MKKIEKTLDGKAKKAHDSFMPSGQGRKASLMMGAAPIIRLGLADKGFEMAQAKRNQAQAQEAPQAQASIFSLSSLSFEGMDSKAINALMDKLHKEAQEAKAALRAAEKKAKEAAKEAAKTAKSREGGDIEKLAKILASIEKEAPLTKKEIFSLYLEALGLAPEDERAIKKEATLNAQLGSRIASRLEKLGRKLGSVREDGVIRYYTLPLSADEAEA